MIGKPKFDWYQTDDLIVLNVLIKKIDTNFLEIKFENEGFLLRYNPKESEEQSPYELCLNLHDQINPTQCSYQVSSVKAEIKLKKMNNYRWSRLERSSLETEMNIAKSESTADGQTTTIKPPAKRWDDIVKQVEKEEEDSGSVEEFFRKIYASGDESLRRAMNKSFVESNGTVLSTNWSEVGQKTVECQPPSSSELKKWD